ncbi:MAG TPA: response regulator [Candidatus Acidoferrales bacterium]|nr:response regulator [Candidatus Acidoferrales bacterium]
MSDTLPLTAVRIPVIYFIDDSATMREVMKIAFRKEQFQVITCADAASALAQFAESAPDAVITDVIMPDKDGYEVCQFIKQHEQFGRTPVILMSGVVNRSVAEKAMAVKADELIRKPFQPHDLIARVKGLIHPKPAPDAAADLPAASPAPPPRPAASLTSLFAPPAAPAVAAPRPHAVPNARAPIAAPPTQPAEVQKLRNEIRRLELLVKKLQAELEAQQQYCAALEAHFKTVQETI